MINVNCNAFGPQTEAPVLHVDSGGAYVGQFESAVRVRFFADDSEAKKTANFTWGRTTVPYTMPPTPGAYEGPSLTYGPLVDVPVPLNIQRDVFLKPDGSRYNIRGNCDFLVQKRLLEGANIDQLLTQRYNAGSRTISTLGMWRYGPELFDPRVYGEAFYANIKPSARFLASRGFYWMPIIFADMQYFNWSMAEQQAHLGRWAREVAGEPNVLPILVNEFQKAGFDPYAFSKPQGTGVWWSRGSGTADTAPPRPAWDWTQFEGRRDWPKRLFAHDDGWYVDEGLEGDPPRPIDQPHPCVFTEVGGWWHTVVPNRRYNDPVSARILGLTSCCYGRGSLAMTEQSLNATLWDPVTEACVVAQISGVVESGL